MHALCTPRDTPIHQSHTGISVLEFFYKRRAIECGRAQPGLNPGSRASADMPLVNWNMKYHKAVLICSLLAIGIANCLNSLNHHVDVVTAQVNDTVILQPIQPTSGLSACPGQDVTLNCTIVRMTTLSEVIPPTLIWQYRGDTIAYNSNSPDSSYYTAVFHAVGLTVMSTATINSVPLSHHKSMINCFSPQSAIHSETITIAGNEV